MRYVHLSPDHLADAKNTHLGAEDYQSDTYRAVYTVKFKDAVYVLHCFQKKSSKGIATPKPDLDKIRERLKAVEQHLKGQ